MGFIIQWTDRCGLFSYEMMRRYQHAHVHIIYEFLFG